MSTFSVQTTGPLPGDNCRLRQVGTGTLKVTGIAGGGWPLPTGYAR